MENTASDTVTPIRTSTNTPLPAIKTGFLEDIALTLRHCDHAQRQDCLRRRPGIERHYSDSDRYEHGRIPPQRGEESDSGHNLIVLLPGTLSTSTEESDC